MRLCLFFILLFQILTTCAQSFTRFSISGSVHGSVTGSINTSSSNQIVSGNQTYAAYVDSANAFESPRLSFGAAVWGHKFITKRWGVQVGLAYEDVGFNRKQSNIQYLDPLYPGMGKGKLLELSSGSGEKSVIYSYRYQYIQLPVLVHYEVFSSKDFYYKISLTGGMGFNLLLNHQMTATLDQFVVDGESRFQFDSTGYNARFFTMNFMIGARSEYRFDKKTIVYAMPILGLYPISVSSGALHSYPYYFQVILGVQYALTFSDDRGR